MSEIGRPHPAVERYVSKAVSPNERIEALEAEVERLTRERDEARAERDGLAKALRRLVRELTKADPMHTSGTFASETLEEARAALARAPKENDDA